MRSIVARELDRALSFNLDYQFACPNVRDDDSGAEVVGCPTRSHSVPHIVELLKHNAIHGICALLRH